jgi:fructose-bisphosphate aldolase class I
MLFTTPGLSEFISGVILFDETLRQKTREGTPFTKVLTRQGIIPGIKVDKGAKPLARFPQEKITEGLDGLRERLVEYGELGARFTKWRAVIAIGEDLPSCTCIEANAHALAQFAALSQEAGLTPIVEPEVLMDGNHTIERSLEVTTAVLQRVFIALAEYRVAFDQMLLKSSMVLPGSKFPRKAGPEEVAEFTLRCLRQTVPAAVTGIVFLSGGQGGIEATQNLNAINSFGAAPWELSFSFGRALQAPALEAWKGQETNVIAAQKILLHRARCNNAARYGKYTKEMETGN